MTRKSLAAVVYATAAVAAVAYPAPLSLGLVAACTLLLSAGYRFRHDFLLVFSGWLLYIPLATALWPLLGEFWAYLAVGTYLAVITERLSFEDQLSSAIEDPGGVDAESKRRAKALSRAHMRRLAQVAGLVGAVAVLTAVGSLFFTAVDALVVAAAALLIAVGLYATQVERMRRIPGGAV